MVRHLLQGSAGYRYWGGHLLLRVFAPVALVVALLASGGVVSAQTSPAEDLAQLRLHLDAAAAALANGDAATAAAEFAAFDSGWFDIEDGVRAQSRGSYRAIETAMNDVVAALATQDTATTSAAFDALWRECDKFITGDPAPEASSPH